MNGLVRPRRGRLLAGVCAGLAQRFAIPTWVVRLVFVASIVIPGSQVLVYVILWIIMPAEGTSRADAAGGFVPRR